MGLHVWPGCKDVRRAPKSELAIEVMWFLDVDMITMNNGDGLPVRTQILTIKSMIHSGVTAG